MEHLSENNSSESGHLALISVSAVAKRLEVKRDATAINWMRKNGIQIHVICSKQKVFEIEVDTTIDKLYAKGLMQKHPTNWEEKYQVVAKDMVVCQQVIEELKGESWQPPRTMVKPLSESDNKVLKKLRA